MGFLSGTMVYVWLATMVILFVIEALIPGLVSIWFGFGAFAALISAMFKAPIWLQVLWFLVISIATLIFTRPFVKKYVNSRTQPTNADVIIGKECVVREAIDNLMGQGAVSAGGKVWSARTEDDNIKPAVGDVVVVLRIEGVKLIVAPVE